ncbi:MAG: hypothetical protein ABFD16_11375 [Thermoguttaceae bacterium]|jgi:hypothetical protein
MKLLAILRMLPLFGVILYACGMGIYFVTSAFSSPPESGVIPVSLAFLTVALLGIAVAIVLGGQEHRIRKLERQAEERDADKR